MIDCRAPAMPFICTNRVVGIITQPESSIPSKQVTFSGPSVVLPLSSTTSIAAAQAPASPQSHARTSPMVKGKLATVIGPSEAQDDGTQSTATSFARPVEHGSDVCMRSFFILCEGCFFDFFPQRLALPLPYKSILCLVGIHSVPRSVYCLTLFCCLMVVRASLSTFELQAGRLFSVC